MQMPLKIIPQVNSGVDLKEEILRNPGRFPKIIFEFLLYPAKSPGTRADNPINIRTVAGTLLPVDRRG